MYLLHGLESILYVKRTLNLMEGVHEVQITKNRSIWHDTHVQYELKCIKQNGPARVFTTSVM
jgi:hypothetical protein